MLRASAEFGPPGCLSRASQSRLAAAWRGSAPTLWPTQVAVWSNCLAEPARDGEYFLVMLIHVPVAADIDHLA